ncbi:uncharacterized protein LOC134237397 [Saccostrea cucullata]|uniref:uncharacterized protein LOC134237397 n=1 Tax=Saccostrea cuccullata TaxID=36930 RepID=UPI002ED34FD0
MNDKRMYATKSRTCPVEMLKFFMSKTDQNATHLFNKCTKEALSSSFNTCNVWYTDQPMKQRSFVNFLPEICKAAGCKRYTAHCLRATAIQTMNDAGFEKKTASATLSTMSRTTVSTQNLGEKLDEREDQNLLETPDRDSHNLQIVPHSNLPTTDVLNVSTMQANSSGILNSSRFENCKITINVNPCKE